MQLRNRNISDCNILNPHQINKGGEKEKILNCSGGKEVQNHKIINSTLECEIKNRQYRVKLVLYNTKWKFQLVLCGSDWVGWGDFYQRYYVKLEPMLGEKVWLNYQQQYFGIVKLLQKKKVSKAFFFANLANNTLYVYN